MRGPPVVGSESARIDPVGRGGVLYVVHEESPECTLETDKQLGS
jgi:hypothetical protein